MASCTYNPGINSSNPYAVLNVTQSSQSIEQNTTTVRYELILYRPYSISSSAAKSYSVTINGTNVASGSTTIGGSGSKTIASGTLSVPHNADGTKSISFSFSLGFEITWSGVWIGTGSASGSMTLTTIPRASKVTVSGTLTTGNTITVNTNRASSGFTHTIRMNYGYVDVATYTNVGASIQVPLDTSKYAPHCTDRTQRQLWIYCKTFSGSTQIGSETMTAVDLKIADSVVPTISGLTVNEAEEGLKAKFGAYIKDKSKLSAQISAAGIYGSTISSYSTKIIDKTYAGASFTSDVLTEAGSVQVVATVTDSRGRKASKTITISVEDYAPPIINSFTVVRANSSGIADAIGTYALMTLDFAITELNSKNDKIIKIEYKRTDATEWVTLETMSQYSYKGTLNGGEVLNKDYTYTFRLTVTDYFSVVSTGEVNVPTAFTLINYHRSGNSICFGGVSTRGDAETAIDFKMDLYDKYGAAITNGMARHTGSGENAIDPDTTTEELILTDLNTPTGRYMYIRTTFYGDKTAQVNRAQVAIPYSSIDSMYHRYYYNGAWSSWRRHMNHDEARILAMTVAAPSGETTVSGQTMLNLSSLLGNTAGSLLTQSGGGIKIGAGISSIMVSASLFAYANAVGNGYVWASICRVRGSDWTEHAVALSVTNAGVGYVSVNIPPLLLSVQEGDIIKLRKLNTEAMQIRGLGNTWLTVEVANIAYK